MSLNFEKSGALPVMLGNPLIVQQLNCLLGLADQIFHCLGCGFLQPQHFSCVLWKPEQRLLYSVDSTVMGYLQNVKRTYSQVVTT
jgi:hypothetical protein